MNKAEKLRYRLSPKNLDRLNRAMAFLWQYDPDSNVSASGETEEAEDSPYSTETEKTQIEYMRTNKINRSQYECMKREMKARELEHRKKSEEDEKKGKQVEKGKRYSKESGYATDDGRAPTNSTPHYLKCSDSTETNYEASSEDSTPSKQPEVKKSKLVLKVCDRKKRLTTKTKEPPPIPRSPSAPQLFSCGDDNKDGEMKRSNYATGTKRKLY